MTDTTAVPGTTEPTTGTPDAGDGFRTRALAIARELNSIRGVTGRRGRLAELRRLRDDACEIPPEVFWELVHRFSVPEREDRFWIRLLPHMARVPHDARVPLGLALVCANLPAQRLERWLRTDHPDAWRELPRLLARVDGGIDWVAVAVLMRFWTPELRRRVARDYFRSPEYRRSQSDQGAT